jgi:hypothetical protein
MNCDCLDYTLDTRANDGCAHTRRSGVLQTRQDELFESVSKKEILNLKRKVRRMKKDKGKEDELK